MILTKKDRIASSSSSSSSSSLMLGSSNKFARDYADYGREEERSSKENERKERTKANFVRFSCKFQGLSLFSDVKGTFKMKGRGQTDVSTFRF